MNRFIALVALFPTLLCAQSVPNGTITQGQVWTPDQWNFAWSAKQDYVQIAPESFYCNPSNGVGYPIVCGIGSTLTLASNALNLNCGNVNEQTSSYTIATTDGCNVVAVNDPFSATGVSIPSAASAGFAPPFKFTLVNQNVNFPLSVTPAAGSIIYNGAAQANLWMLPNTSCDFSSDGTNWETSACTTTLNPTGVGNPLQTSNTNGDTILKYASGSFNSTAGSPNISFGTSVSATFAGSTIVVTGCGQLVATAPITVTSGGTGYAVGDTVTLAAGSGGALVTAPVLTVTWVSGGVVQAISATNVRAGVEVTGNGGNITTWPTSGSFTQASTSGSGTGLTVNMTEAALPLSTTITAGFAGGTTVSMNANCSQSFTNGTQFVALGHDDQPGITAAIASGNQTVLLPSGHVYGIRTPIIFQTSTSRPQTLDCQGSIIVALAPMAEMIETQTQGSIFQSEGMNGMIKNCQFEGMGISVLNALQGADWMLYDHVGLRDATTANLEVAVVGGGGSLAINNSFRTLTINNETLMVPNEPQYCVYLTGNVTDNHFVDGIWNGCQQAGVRDTTFGTFYDDIHIYGVINGPDFQSTGGALLIKNLYADNPEGSYCGISLAGSNTDLVGWTVLVSGSYNTMNQSGVCVTGTNLVVGGVWQQSTLTAAAGCVPPASGGGHNASLFLGNLGCTVQNPITPIFFAFNSGAVLTSNSANYCVPNGSVCSTSSTANVVTVPRTCQLQNFYLGSTNNTDIGNGDTYVALLVANGGNTAITCTLTGTGTTTSPCSDTTDTATINAGQILQVKVTTSSGSTAVRVYGAMECLAFH